MVSCIRSFASDRHSLAACDLQSQLAAAMVFLIELIKHSLFSEEGIEL
jgi:hypothetical protein